MPTMLIRKSLAKCGAAGTSVPFPSPSHLALVSKATSHTTPRATRFCAAQQQYHGACDQQPSLQAPVSPSQPLSSSTPSTLRPHSSAPILAVGALLLAAIQPEAASALQMEPANALSLPTWAIHVSSVVEWAIAMGLMWRYAEVTGNARWKGMTWGMLPALGSAMCACTWHLFYNSPDLEFLVALQAFLTLVGNFTCFWAAYRIWDGAKSDGMAS